MTLLLPDSHSSLTFPFLQKQDIQQPFQKAASSVCSIQHIQLLFLFSSLKLKENFFEFASSGLYMVIVKGEGIRSRDSEVCIRRFDLNQSL